MYVQVDVGERERWTGFWCSLNDIMITVYCNLWRGCFIPAFSFLKLQFSSFSLLFLWWGGGVLHTLSCGTCTHTCALEIECSVAVTLIPKGSAAGMHLGLWRALGIKTMGASTSRLQGWGSTTEQSLGSSLLSVDLSHCGQSEPIHIEGYRFQFIKYSTMWFSVACMFDDLDLILSKAINK